jgi:hypothetical protein
MDGEQIGAHRYSFILAHGSIPDSAGILHRCDNPPCVNPAHLYAGTQKSNMADAALRQRLPRGERHYQAKLTAESVRVIRLRHAAGETMAALALEFGVCRVSVFSVVHGETWKHVV